MNGVTIRPMMGWPVGLVIAVAMAGFAIAGVVVYVRRRGLSDETLTACIRRTLLPLLIAAMALTPSIVTTTTSRAVNTTDVVVAVDVTGSMGVDDARYGSQETMPRIAAARKAVEGLTGMYPNSSFAALRFGAAGTLDVPLTPDTLAIRSWADTLTVEPTSVSAGSKLDAPLDQLLVQLKAMRENRPDDAIVLYMITDGEQTASGARRTFSSLRQYLDDAFTIGVGSKQGGKIPVATDNPSGGTPSAKSDDAGPWVNDPSTGKPGISMMNPDNLHAIADEMNGTSVIMDASHTITNATSAKRSTRWRLSQTPKQRERVSPVIWPLAIGTTLLLAWEAGAWLAMSRRMI
ncbi:VWA domain-containing protein [Bifidobacterium mongoliense]|uniref:VWA domain-containing protein n=1 Tax=Bifidobacterium mongoliense TaxID=518643 RepID=UPI002647E289|nr:VWA domain-containing protein [Bifidobacterium mongoliense]MDN5979908.1 VWA domain-containing protein [Bifidobacterium mongoliense]MDN6769159.1 VWA domain-containing protein [Bifidobacterium mongoliense]MDN6782757.1 VWA domain-containing protein [Bifidobacterium mongoliense]